MALMDTVKQLMKGRSESVERGIDTAVDRLGRYSETMKERAEAMKARARTLDPDRDAPGSGVASTDPVPTAEPASRPVTPADPPTTAAGPSLRGDLVDDDDRPVEPPPF